MIAGSGLRRAGSSSTSIRPLAAVSKSFALASLDELDEAVAAARAAFEEWRRWTPDARRDVLFKLAGMLEARGEELGTIIALEGGQPFSPMAGWYPSLWFRYYAGWADKLTGERINAYPLPGVDFTAPEPIGVVGLFVASNGPLGFLRDGGSSGAGCRLLPRHQIARDRALLGAHVRPTLSGGGHSAGCGERRERRTRHRARDGFAPRYRQDQLHRRCRDGAQARRRLRVDAQTDGAGTRWQVGQHRVRTTRISSR